MYPKGNFLKPKIKIQTPIKRILLIFLIKKQNRKLKKNRKKIPNL